MVSKVRLYSTALALMCIMIMTMGIVDQSDAVESTTTFVGTVLEDGSPLEGVAVSVNGEVSIPTKDDGTFEFEYTGTANFTLSMRNYVFQSSDITKTESGFSVTSPQTTGTILAFKTAENYSGTVVSGTSPIHNADVTYADSDGNSYTAETGSDGKYTIVCPPSEYTVTVRCNGYETNSTAVTSTDMTITLAPKIVSIGGIIMDYSANGDPVPLVGVNVKVLSGSSSSTDISGSDGFSVSFTYSQSATITFSLNGYKVTVPGLSHVLTKQADGLTYRIDLTDAEVVDDLYMVSTSDSPVVMIKNMSKITGIVKGSVNNTEYALSNATIRIDSGNGNVYETKTDETGKFTIRCPFGEYQLTSECSGFLVYGPVSVHTSETDIQNIVMEAYGGSFIPGLDNAHSMMVLAIGVLILILAFATVCYISSKKGIGNIKADNDLDDDTDDE